MYLFGVKGRDFKSTQMRGFDTFEEAFDYAVGYGKQRRDCWRMLQPCDYDSVVYDLCIWEVFSDKPPVRIKSLMEKLTKELWPELQTYAEGEVR